MTSSPSLRTLFLVDSFWFPSSLLLLSDVISHLHRP
jgi:hypothetical protein